MDISFIKVSIYEIGITAVYLINFLVVLNLIFRQKRDIETTFAWILILTTIPFLGFVLYIAFGRGVSKNNMFKIKKAEDKILKNNIIDTELKLVKDALFEPNITNHKDMIYALTRLNNAKFSDNNSVNIYEDSTKFFDQLLIDLKNAKQNINIQFYIFKDDNIGNEIIDILIQKSKEGVEVRFLYDAVGSRLLSDKAIDKLNKANIKTASFFPSFMKLFNFNLNYRNHRKIVVIDSKVGFVGGNNVGDEYLGRDSKFGYWRDTHLRITGDSVRDLEIRFLLDWRYSSKEDLDLNRYFNEKKYSNNPHLTLSNRIDNVGIQIVCSGPDMSELAEIKYGYIKMMQNAKKYIYIQSPYFILDKTIIDTLKIACLSGVDVRIMIPGKPDHPFVKWASHSYTGELLEYGAKLYNYNKNSFLHSKAVVIDDAVCSIGTANMDIRSFELNFEVNAFIYSSKIARKQKLVFENDILNSKEVTLESYNSRATSIKIKEAISRLLSPIL